MGDGFAGCCGFGGFGAYGWIGMILYFVITLAVIIGIIILAIWLVRRFSNRSHSVNQYSNQGQPPREILQARYARGEIDRDEYKQMLGDLN